MFTLQKRNSKTRRRGTSRAQIAIREVRDGIVMLPHGQYRIILEVTPINFELKSEEEQDAIIDMYESFLNSVSVSLQILVRTRQIDMDKYLENLRERLAGETEIVYRQQIEYYDEFIRSLIQSNKILSRHFYIIVPLYVAGQIDFETAREQLQLTADIVSKGIARIGIRTRQLTSLEALDLFYSFYSPTQAKLQPLTSQALQLVYTTLVKGEQS